MSFREFGLRTILCLALVGTAATVWVTPSMGATHRQMDVRVAALAGSGHGLWLAKGGREKDGHSVARVYAFTGSGWRGLPGTFEYPNRGPLRITTRKSGRRAVPCLGYQGTGDVSRVACRQGGRWLRIKIGSEFDRFEFEDLGARGRRLVALFTDTDSSPSRAQLAVARGNTFVKWGPPTTAPGSFAFFRLGSRTLSAPRSVVDVGVQTFRGRRWVATMSHGKWRRSRPLPADVPGPQSSGPVRTGSALFMPVSEALFQQDGRAWEFSVYKTEDKLWRRVTGSPLNRTRYNAQGGAYAAGDEVWASWDEMSGEADSGGFATELFAKRVDRKGSEVEGIWKGHRLQQGVQGVARYGTRIAVLYLVQSPDSVAMDARVRFLR